MPAVVDCKMCTNCGFAVLVVYSPGSNRTRETPSDKSVSPTNVKSEKFMIISFWERTSYVGRTLKTLIRRAYERLHFLSVIETREPSYQTSLPSAILCQKNILLHGNGYFFFLAGPLQKRVLRKKNFITGDRDQP